VKRDFQGAAEGGARLALGVLAVAAAALFCAAPAGAAEFHPFKYSIDGTGTDAGQFSRIEDVAVHQSDGTIYVLDRNHLAIDRFDADGNPEPFPATGKSSLDLFETCQGFSPYQYGGTGLAVDSSGTANDGTIYAVGEFEAGVCALNSAGEFLWRIHYPENPEVGGACGATTDQLGRLWVVAGSLFQFTATGSPPTLVTITEPAGTCRAAVGSGGRLYVANPYANPDGNFAGAVERWSVLGPQQLISPRSNGSIGLDPDTEHIYAGHSQEVDEFTSEGERVSEIGVGVPYALTGLGTIGQAKAIAVRGSTGEVFVADAATDTLKVYGPREVFPDVTTGSASSIQRDSVEVGGQVEPAGEDVTSCVFEWGETTSYGNSENCAEATPYAAAKSVSAELIGLAPGSTYHYRLVAENAAGPNWGGDGEFTTPYVNGVETKPATAVTRKAATLNGSLEPDGIDAHYYFEWGTDQEYGHSSPAAPTDAGSGVGSTPATVDIAGLDIGTTYHYRLVATNADGTTYGDDATFKTGEAVTGVETKAPSAVTQREATLNGALEPENLPTTFYFEWGPTASYGSTTGPPGGEPVQSGTGSTTVSAEIAGLTVYTSYHYRLVATNAEGTTYGADESVTTAPPLLPTVTGTAASDVTATSASLSATINPGFGQTVYRFQYGKNTEYESRTAPLGPLDEDGTNHPVEFTATDLAPGTTYHFRAVALNFAGVTYGPDQVFTTPGPPTVGTTTVSGVTSRSARVDVAITPALTATTFRVEYSNGNRTGETAVGATGSVSQMVSTELTGLAPATNYRIHVVATNALGTDAGGDQSFTTQTELSAPAKAPPCRKGRVRQKGRCVKKHVKRRHRAKRRNRAHSRAGTKAGG